MSNSTLAGSIRVTTAKSLHSNLAIVNIIWLEGASNYTIFHMVDGKTHMSAYTIGHFLRQLPDFFFRIHKSHVINLAYVKCVGVVDRQLLVTLKDANETKLAVSRLRRAEFRRNFNAKLSNGQ